MTHRIGILLLASTAMIAPAAAQENAGQAAAKQLLQAADNAIGASKVKSYVSSSTGWRGYPGQQFAEGDLPRTDVKQTRTVDFASKSAKTEYVRTQGNNGIRGGGAGFPVQGEQKFVEVINHDVGWNVNAQGEPTRILATDAGDRQLFLWTNPVGFILPDLPRSQSSQQPAPVCAVTQGALRQCRGRVRGRR